MKLKPIIFTFIFSILLCCVLMFSASAKTIQLGPEDFKPYSVKTKGSGDNLSETYTYNSNGLLTKTVSTVSRRTTVAKYTYDSKGNLTKQVYRTSGGDTTTETLSYDSKGNLTKQVKKFPNGGYNTSTFSYDSKGRLAKSKLLYNEEYPFIYTYKYNSENKLSSKTCKYDAQPALAGYSTTTYQYNSDGSIGLKKETQHYTYNEGLETTTKYSYNAKGQITKETYQAPGNSVGTTTYKYDSNGKLSKKVYKDPYGTTENCTYDSHENLIKKVTKYPNGSSYTETFTYNAKNALTKSVHKGSDGSSSTFSYKTISGKVENSNEGYDIILDYVTTTYDGKAKKPNVSIKNYFPGKDYKVTYSNNVNIGTGKIIIDFINDKLYDDTYDDRDDIEISFEIKPAAPKNVQTLSSNANSAKLSWSKVPGAAKYEVFKYTASSKKYSKIATVTEAGATITNLKANAKYQFCVRAISKSGVKSAMSQKALATTYSSAPKAPQKLTATSSKSAVTISWAASKNATSYEVYTYNSSSKKYANVASVSSNKATIKNLKAGTKYTFCIKAANNAGKSGYSSKLSVTTKK